MERYRLKNIIILILVLLNAFLLVSLGIRGTKEHTARRAQQQELVALFAADGMTLDPALIPSDTELSAYTLIREESLEKRVAVFWLGSISERTAQGGGIYTYSGSHGAAVFRDTGSFDIAGALSSGDAESLCGTSAKNSPTRNRCSLWTKPAVARLLPCACGVTCRCLTAPSRSRWITAQSQPSAAPCSRIPARPRQMSSPCFPLSPP